MNIKKYFWGLNDNAIKETEKIFRNPYHPKYVMRMHTILSRCNDIDELFSIIDERRFIEIWPKIRQYWSRRAEGSDFRAWWETVYEQLLQKKKKVKIPRGKLFSEIQKIGALIKKARVNSGWTQADFAKRIGMEQPDISAIEKGRKNITLGTLIIICKALGIKQITVT